MFVNYQWVALILLLKSPVIRGDFEYELNAVTNQLTKKYFRYPCIIYVKDEVQETIPFPKFKELMVIVNLNSEECTMEFLSNIYSLGCKGFIVRSQDRQTAVERLIKGYKKSAFSGYNDKRYLFVPKDENDDNTTFLEGKYMYYMPNLVFLSPKNTTDFEIVGHNFFNGYKYDVLGEKVEVLDVWQSGVGLTTGKNLYPDRITNLNGKLLKLGVMHYSPYTIVMRNGDRIQYDGLETRIAWQFVMLKNGTWAVKDHPVFLWGDLFIENGTGNGILGSVYEQKVDMGYAAIYQWHCDVMECSYPYVYAGVTCLVPKPLPISAWFTVILPFEKSVWTAIFCSYMMCSVIAFVVSYLFQRLKYAKRQSILTIIQGSFFQTFRVLLEQSSKDLGAHTPLFAFYKFWTVYCFFVAVCWQGGIASFLTVPRFEEPIDEAHDLTMRWPKVEWGANHIDWTKSIEQTSDPITLKIVKDFVVLDNESLRKRVPQRNFGYFMERLPNGHYGVPDYIGEPEMKYLRIMKYNIYTANCVIVLPKCSPYLESLDKILFWMFDTGLIQKLEIQTSLEMINNRLQNMIRISAEKESGGSGNVSLVVDHILGAIFIYVIGITFSTIVFLAEGFYYRRATITLKKTGDINIQIMSL